MGEIIRVEPEKIRSAAEEIKSSASKYDKIAKELMENATQMGEAWKGTDNQTYVNQIKGFVEDLENMVKKLNQVSDTLEQQAQNYIKRQEANVENAQRLQN